MNEIDNNISNKIMDLNIKINNLNNDNSLKKNLKKKCLLFTKINEHLDLLNDIIDDYQLNDIKEFQIDKEIDIRIKENEFQKEIIDVFGPYILLYQLSKNSL